MVNENLEEKWEFLFGDGDEETEELEELVEEELIEKEEDVKEDVREEPKEEPKKENRPAEKKILKKEPIRMNNIEIFFDGFITASGVKVKAVAGCEINIGNLRFLFGENSVKIYEV
ncbi:MAG: hypothetical protein WBK47_05660 [Acetomicrobium sp.]